MAVYNYRKFKISLAPNSSKTQGLRAGDIVRRQYFDNQLKQNPDGSYTGSDVGVVYSLMCVLDTGTDYISKLDEDGVPVVDEHGDEVKEKCPWFIGALIDGDAPSEGELLDFVRITNLFDTDRSGALYLTASDDTAPFMDIIDGIGRNESLCWPEDLAITDTPDCESQYCVQGTLVSDYQSYNGDGRNRVLHMTKVAGGNGFTGLQQDFYKYVANPNMVLVSYWAKASASVNATVSLGYTNGLETDGSVDVEIGSEWKYYFHAITVDWSGRHLRTLKMDLGGVLDGEEVWIADFSIILLSSVANFQAASKVRVGRLDGVVDPVFGRLDGYGGYLQKLFASQSAHISGTLTAGDENGFGASFYAGKIHKNVLVNSLGLNTVGGAIVESEKHSPVGVGNIIQITTSSGLIVQSNEWLCQKVGETYTFSFWAYSDKPCIIDLFQNDKHLGALYINVLQTKMWVRLHKTFDINELSLENEGQDLIINISPVFQAIDDEDVQDILLFTAPQFESGSIATQYQPTDNVLNYTEDYGAWFDRGGIGGTIQNPLLRLNYDGKGGIASRQNSPTENPSFALNQNGSGHIAKGNISWDEVGDVTLGKGVHLNWENLGEDVQQELLTKSVKIIGLDTFTLLGDATGATPTTDPLSITLSLQEQNIQSDINNRVWQYEKDGAWVDFSEGQNNGRSIVIWPYNKNPDYWDGASMLMVRCVVTVNGQQYSDVITIRKQLITGYTLEITSSMGLGFKNDSCQTVLTCNVYYKGKLVDPEYCAEHYMFYWRKYDIVDGKYVEDEDFWKEPGDPGHIDRTQQQIVLNYAISGTDYFTCELMFREGFTYDFPIYF